jgi:uncharacterized damage-inducible protein DinB
MVGLYEEDSMNYYGTKELAESFRTVRKNTIQAAEEIPEDKYGFRPAEGTRTVEKMLTHIALSHQFQHRFHAVEKRRNFDGFDFPALFAEFVAEEAKPRTKAQVVALLKESGDAWAKVLDGLSDEFLAEIVTMPAGSTPATKSRFEMVLSVKEHEMHHRGQIMLVQRMIGIVPHLTRQFQERMAAPQAQQTQQAKS